MLISLNIHELIKRGKRQRRTNSATAWGLAGSTTRVPATSPSAIVEISVSVNLASVVSPMKLLKMLSSKVTHKMITGPRAGEDLSYTQSGRRQWRSNREETLWMAVFTDIPQHDPSRVPSRFGLSEAERIRAATAKTAVHELGHHLRVGEA